MYSPHTLLGNGKKMQAITTLNNVTLNPYSVTKVSLFNISGCKMSINDFV